MAVEIQYTTVASDVAPAISVDLASNLSEGIRSLAEILGVNDMYAMSAGTMVNIYKSKIKGSLRKQPASGETVPLTEVERTAVSPELSLDFYRKVVTAQAIQKAGRENALYDTDRALIGAIRKAIKASFFTAISAGTGTVTAQTTFQKQLAQAWSAIHTYFEDVDSEPVHFVNPADVADYLGTATITTQNAFGFDYVEDFLGLGTVIFSANVTKGTVISTAKANLRGAYVPANGEVGTEFGMTADESGLVGICHKVNTSMAGIESLFMTGVKFYPEDLAGVFKGTITSN
jgi:hypothetical protein